MIDERAPGHYRVKTERNKQKGKKRSYIIKHRRYLSTGNEVLPKRLGCCLALAIDLQGPRRDQVEASYIGQEHTTTRQEFNTVCAQGKSTSVEDDFVWPS